MELIQAGNVVRRSPGAKHGKEAAAQESAKITIFYVINKINSQPKTGVNMQIETEGTY